MSAVGGTCGKCGAPYFFPMVWHGVTPPPATPSCACWNMPVVTTGSTILLTPFDDAETEHAMSEVESARLRSLLVEAREALQGASWPSHSVSWYRVRDLLARIESEVGK